MDAWGELNRREVVFRTAVAQLAVDALARSTRLYVPVDTGELRDSGNVTTRKGVTEVRYAAPHAGFVHFSPEFHPRPDPARPKAGGRFLDRAVLDVLAGAAAKVGAQVGGRPTGGSARPPTSRTRRTRT